MSRKIWGDTDYYSTTELFKNKGKDVDSYMPDVNKVTNDFFVLFSRRFDSADNPFRCWIEWDGYISFSIPFNVDQNHVENLSDWWDFITHPENIEVDDRRCILYSFFNTYKEQPNNQTYVHTIQDKIIYFLRDDWFKIETYLDIDLPVENFQSEWTTNQISTICQKIEEKDVPLEIRKTDLHYIDPGTTYPEITKSFFSYDRTYDGWFGYIFKPNQSTNKFLSYDTYHSYENGIGRDIPTVRISRWDSEAMTSELNEKLNESVPTDQAGFNEYLLDCLFIAGIVYLGRDIHGVYENVDWCLRNDLEILFNKLEDFRSSLIAIKTKIGDSIDLAIENFKNLLDNYEDDLITLRGEIRTEGGEYTQWYLNQSTTVMRQECWLPLYQLFWSKLQTLAVDYTKWYNNGFRYLTGNLIEKEDTTDSIRIYKEGNYYKLNGTQTTLITTQPYQDIDFNIQEYLYYLLVNYSGNPMDIYYTVFDANPDIRNGNILMFLENDLKIVNNKTGERATDQETAIENISRFFRYFDSIDDLDSIWKVFESPDTFNRYMVTRAKMYRSTEDLVGIWHYKFEPGNSDDVGRIQLWLTKEPVTDPKHRIEENGKFILPELEYETWFLKGKQIVTKMDDTVMIGEDIWYKSYWFKYKNGSDTFVFPRLRFDFSTLPYSEPPEVPTEWTQEEIDRVNTIEVRMAYGLDLLCKNCVQTLGDYSEYTIYQVECYDGEELKHFYDYMNAFITYEQTIRESLSDRPSTEQIVSAFEGIIKRVGDTWTYYSNTSAALSYSSNRAEFWSNLSNNLTVFLKDITETVSDINIYRLNPDMFSSILKINTTRIIATSLEGQDLENWIANNSEGNEIDHYTIN